MPDTAEVIELPTADPVYAPIGPWRMQFRILKALILRDMASRHGDSRLGYLMGIIMPLITIASIMILFNLRGRIAPADFPLAVFLASGYPIWISFQRTYGQVMASAAKSDSLLAFPQITQLDLIIASAILNAATDTVVYVIVVGVVALLLHGPTTNFAGVIMLYWAALWMGINFGLLFCGLRRVVPFVVSFVNMFLRLGMWVSGVLFTVDRLPPSIWPYLKWNPMLHIIEGLRHNWVGVYDPPIYDPKFIVVANIIMTMLGLAIERATRRHVGD